MTEEDLHFNAPPGWDLTQSDWSPPQGWNPPPNWRPVPSWPSAPAGWKFWVDRAPGQTESLKEPTTRSVAAPSKDAAVDDTGALRARIAHLEQQVVRLRSEAGVVDLNDERVLQEVGIYRYHHPLEHATDYRGALKNIQDQVKALAKAGDAVLASDMFTYNNSLAQGRKMTRDFSKLMLRAYNAEADNCVRTVKAGNVVTAKRRLETSVEAVARLGAMMEMKINPEYHELRNRELEFTADFLMKVQVEKEVAREERARLREERKVAAELAAERERLEKEQAHYRNVLAALAASDDESAKQELSDKISELARAIEDNDFRAANIRAGFVYVISNRGAFGPNIVKIGLTRRLEPLERVRELGGASVPFPFDVHALYFSDDAVTLENELHKAFASVRVNHVNLRREFFFASPDQVRTVLQEKVGNLLEFSETSDAMEYCQSRSYWPPAAAVTGPPAS